MTKNKMQKDFIRVKKSHLGKKLKTTEVVIKLITGDYFFLKIYINMTLYYLLNKAFQNYK